MTKLFKSLFIASLLLISPLIVLASVSVSQSNYVPPADPHYTQSGNYTVLYNVDLDLGICGDVSSVVGERVASNDCTYDAVGAFATSTIGNYSAVEVNPGVGCWSGGVLNSYTVCKGSGGFMSEALFTISTTSEATSSNSTSSSGYGMIDQVLGTQFFIFFGTIAIAIGTFLSLRKMS